MSAHDEQLARMAHPTWGTGPGGASRARGAAPLSPGGAGALVSEQVKLLFLEKMDARRERDEAREERDRARSIAAALEEELSRLRGLIDEALDRHIPEHSSPGSQTRCDDCWELWPCTTSKTFGRILNTIGSDE